MGLSLRRGFVAVTLHLGRANGVAPVGRPTETARRSQRCTVPTKVAGRNWEQLDHINLQEIFLSYVEVVHSILEGRLRQYFAMSLREPYRAKQAGDDVAEMRAWKLFGLTPVLLLHRTRGTGSVRRDELAQRRLADDFWPEAQGRGDEFQEQQRSGRAAQDCEGDGDVVGVVTPLSGGAQVVLHGIQVVEVVVRLRVHQDGEVEEDGEGQVEVEREDGEVREKRTWMACGWDEDSRTS